MEKFILSVVTLLFACFTIGQNTVQKDSIVNDTVKNITFNYKQLIIPGILIGYGFWGAESGQIKSFNFSFIPFSIANNFKIICFWCFLSNIKIIK